MSIYFIHLFSELFILSFFAGILGKREKIFHLFLSALIGLIFGFIAYYIFQYEKLINIGNLSAEITLLVGLFLACFFFISRSILISTAILSAAIFMRYFFKSSAFVIFEGSLLDTDGIYNFAFILLAILFCAIFFISFRFFASRVNTAILALCSVFTGALVANDAAAKIVLFAIRKGLIEDEEGYALSYVAKSAYYSEFHSYIFILIGLIIAVFALIKRPQYREPNGDFDIAYRELVAKSSAINKHFCAHFIISVATFCLALYFYLIASKPLQIDEPLIVQPSDEKYFTFPLEVVTDGHLHRYAYISASGKKIRWFIINRFPGKITPTAVFDSCMICGDLGYIERDGELVCVACNVRIFIPSVGKAGGCNPIPIENFEIDEENGLFKIPIREITTGENYFSEVVEVSVIDPVTGAKFLNTAAKHSYLFRGINYYFESQNSYEQFKAAPEQYAPADASAKYRLRG